MVRVLLDMGARADAVNEVREVVPATALAAACSEGSLAMVRLLLESGADASRPLVGRSPLVEAAMRGRPAVVRLLLARGANPNARGSDGSTVLHRTARDQPPFASEIAGLLVERGAEPSYGVHVNKFLAEAYAPAVAAAADAVFAFMDDRDAARLVLHYFSTCEPPPRPLGSTLLFGQFSAGGPAAPRRRRSGAGRRRSRGGGASASSAGSLQAMGGPAWALSVSAGHDRSAARLARCGALLSGVAAAAEQAKRTALIKSRVMVKARRGSWAGGGAFW